MPLTTKVLFIGIDAGDKDLIQQWAAEGELPSLARFINNSNNCEIKNPTGLYVGAVWPSFYTGLSPASHGRYCYRQMMPGTYDVVDINSTQVNGKPLWDYLSDANKRVAVIDVPKSPPPKPLNGIHIADWGTHDPEFEFQTYPCELKEVVYEKFGTDDIGNCNAFRTKESEFLSFQNSLKERVRRRASLTNYILRKGGWDCLFTVFSESHCVGHQCWHIHDKLHIRHDSKIASAIGDPIKSVYAEIDKAIGNILKNVDLKITRVVILASHGIQSHYDATFMLDDMLKALEGKSNIPHFSTTLKKLRIGKIRKVSPRLSNSLKKFIISKYYSSRKAFAVPNNDVYGAIRFNIRGREPHGKLNQGKEYEQYCDQIIDDLMGFLNVKTDQPIIKRILITKDLYKNGSNIDSLPDLLIEWDRSLPISEVYSPKIGIVRGEYKKCRTGDHSESGMIFIADNVTTHEQLERHANVEDIAPTIAKWLDVDLPKVDGQALTF